MHIAIIGNGISGVTAARYIRKQSDHKVTLISAETDYFFSRTALMYIYMGHMRFQDTQPYPPHFWKENNIELKRAYVQQIDFEQKQLRFKEGDSLQYDKLVLALGSKPNKFGWPGQDLEGVRGLYSYQDLEYMEAKSEGLKRAVVVGGGLIGLEMAEMFHSRDIPVTMLVREAAYWSNVFPEKEEADMVSRHIVKNGIDLRLASELKEIVDDGNGNACAVITNTGERIDCGFVGLTAGVSPNIAFLKDTALETQRGILVDNTLETSIKDVYAIGDCAQLRTPIAGRRPIEAVWYTGKMMGEVAAYNICGTAVDYNPGIWYNSAKFLEIEYQVYGEAPAVIPEDMASLYWEHEDGEKAIRINYDKATKVVRGFNLMGIRYRHEVCERWIAEKTDLKEVLTNLGLANFDPEFYEEYEQDLIRQYNQQSGENIQLKKQRGLRGVLAFLKN